MIVLDAIGTFSLKLGLFLLTSPGAKRTSV